MRHLYHDVPLYSGSNAFPQFMDGDVFKLIVPLNDGIAAAGEFGINEDESTTQKTTQKILDFIKSYPGITQAELAKKCGISTDGIKWQIKQLKQSGKIERIGSDKGGHWEVKD